MTAISKSLCLAFVAFATAAVALRPAVAADGPKPDRSQFVARTFTLKEADRTANGAARDSNVDASGVANVHTTVLGRSDHTFDIGLIEQIPYAGHPLQMVVGSLESGVAGEARKPGRDDLVSGSGETRHRR